LFGYGGGRQRSAEAMVSIAAEGTIAGALPADRFLGQLITITDRIA
jgi:hypothetical protein